MKKIIGGLLIVLAVAIYIYVTYMNTSFSQTTRTFSPYTLFTSSWENYKGRFINSDGRVIDSSQGDITTSEGQSYAMLRAVWVDDKPTFDLVWKWTQADLKRGPDNLFEWKWGKRADGSYGVFPNGGDNSASDADSDIALALIFASNRWSDPGYLNEAKKILPDLWNVETDVAGSNRYLIAGNWAKNSQEMVINPSYFAPYAWRIFAKVDPRHDWNGLIDPAYQLLTKATNEPLDTATSAKLPPDWISLNKSNGSIQATHLAGLTTNYSYDAMRIPWRIYLDYKWFNSATAKHYLLSSFSALYNDYSKENTLPSGFTHDGQPLSSSEEPVMYATSLGYFLLAHPNLAQKIYQDKIIKLYSNATNSFNSNLPYYQQNWLWFGSALYNNQLPNLAQ